MILHNYESRSGKDLILEYKILFEVIAIIYKR